MAQSWWIWGRILYSVPLALTGVIYIVNPLGTVESLTSFIPGGLNLIYVGGFLWIMLGLASAFNIMPRYTSFGIIGLLCMYLVMVHIPAATTGEYLNIVWFELLRNISLMGGAFFIGASSRQSEKAADVAQGLTPFANKNIPSSSAPFPEL